MGKVIVNVDWEDNYGAWIDSLPGCVAVAHTYDALKKEIAKSVEMHIAAMKEDGDETPDEFKDEYTLAFKMNTRALLHHYNGIFTQAGLSRITGINQRQIGHYATGHSVPRESQRRKIVDGIRHLLEEFETVV
jgi:hypothetical protein